MAEMTDIGAQLRRARLAAGLTQRELARRANKSHQLIDKVENGQNTTIDTLDALVEAASAELVVNIQFTPQRRPPRPSADRLAVVTRFVAVLHRLPDAVVDGILHDIALWEQEYPPK